LRYKPAIRPGLNRAANYGPSWLDKIEAQFRVLRYFTLAGTYHTTHARLTRRYIHWRNGNTDNPRLKRLINTANVA